MASNSNSNHHIVAIEAIHCPIPDFTLQTPHKKSVHNWTYPHELESRVKDATIIITTTTRLNSDILHPSKTPLLRLIVILASGTDCVDLAAARARGIPVCNCPSTNIDSVSEHAIGLYFALRRKLVHLSGVVRDVPVDEVGGDTEWKSKGSLKGRMKMADGGAPLLCSQETIGIVGFGALGSRISALARGLGMNVLIAERRGVTQARGDRVLFEDVLKRSTFLVLCLPRTPETENMISTNEFRMMSKQAVLINVARGGIVDEKALVEALRDGEISGAGLDVFANEPIGRGDSPLLEGEADGLNLVLSPHLAWFAERTLENLQTGVKKTVEQWCVGNTINRVA
jgi:glycerate dehydrogenase